jgi:hypothetical protein
LQISVQDISDLIESSCPVFLEGGRNEALDGLRRQAVIVIAKCSLVRPSAIRFSRNEGLTASATVEGIVKSARSMAIGDNENPAAVQVLDCGEFKEEI